MMRRSILNRALSVLSLMALLATSPAFATTYNSPTVNDGIPPEIEGVRDTSWGQEELLHDDRGDGEPWGPFNQLHGLWVTWDADGVYFSVTGALWDTPSGVGANAVNLYIDADFGKGTGPSDMSVIAPEALGAVTRNFSRSFTVAGGFGVDWGFTSWAGRFDLGFLDVRDPATPINLFQGVNDAASVNTHTSAEGVIESRDLVGNAGYEVFIPWAVLYPDSPAGEVPAGTQMAVVVAQVGGGDSLSPETIPSDASLRALDGSVVFTVDADGNGVPDEFWPPSGTIEGSVKLTDGSDLGESVEVAAYFGETQVAKATSDPIDGSYRLVRIDPGVEYEVRVLSATYFTTPQQVTAGTSANPAIANFLVELVNSGVDVDFGFTEGPEATTRTLDIIWILVEGNGPTPFAEGRLAPGDATSFRIAPVPPGDYTLLVATESTDSIVRNRTGYDPQFISLTVVKDEYLDLGVVDIPLVVPERVIFSNVTDAGYDSPLDYTAVMRVSQSLPAENFFAFRSVMVVAVDAGGDEALLTLAERTNLILSMTSIDPRQPAEGVASYFTLGEDTAVASAGDRPTLALLDPIVSVPTRAIFRIADDTQEVLRLRASYLDLPLSDLEVRVTPRLPASIDLNVATNSAVAGENVAMDCQLLDISGDPSQTADIVIRFDIEPNTGGAASVIPPAVVSRNDGTVGTEGNLNFSSTYADTLAVQAWAVVLQDTIWSNVEEIVVVPSTPDHIAVDARQAASDRVQAAVRLADEFGNTIAGDPRTVTLSAGPADLVTSIPASVPLEANGVAVFDIGVAENRGGFVELTASSNVPVGPTTRAIELKPGLVATDEIAPESDSEHNSDPGMDLQALFAVVVNDTLEVNVPFASNFGGAHMSLLLEFNSDAQGAFNDPFGFPVSYGHALLPDYVLTYKYAADDYADFRRQAGPPGSWEWYNFNTQTWVPAWEEGVDAKAQGLVWKTATDVFFRIPIRDLKPDFVTGTDTIRVQTYVMQEENDEKRTALDSVPHDVTHDMTGEWWTTATNGISLSNFATAVPIEVGSALRIAEAAFDPLVATQGDSVRLTASVRFEGAAPPNPSVQMFADLSANFGGSALQPMRDDGLAPDVTAGDGVYSVRVGIPTSLLEGDYSVTVQALEVTTSQRAFGRASIDVVGEPELTPILVAEDAVGDDHGPNRIGEPFLYYEYPTSGVFFDGVFDLRKLEVFDVGDRLLFRISITDLTNPAESGAADWNALYPSDDTCPAGSRVDLNLQNIVVLLDTKDGNNIGSTRLPDSRRADVAGQDAWEYALVFDGWWKGVVKSNGESEQGSWETLANDSEFFFCTNDQTNTIDGFLAKDVLAADELSAILNWDIIVLMSGHDGDSNKDNWGGVRWVNEGSPEWQFGGGRNGEGNSDRDPNVIDLLTHAGLTPTGEPKLAGTTQEEQMNFFSPAALDRFAEGESAVRFEATSFVDEVPPSVQWMGITPDRGVIPWAILEDSPVVVRTNLVDDAGVEEATLYWRAPGEPRSAARAVPMGQIRSDLVENGLEWVADIRWTEVEAATASGPLDDPTALADSVRYIYASVEAIDKVGNATSSGGDRVEEAIELPLETVKSISYSDISADAGGDDVSVDLNEGSRVVLSLSALEALIGESDSTTVDLVLSAVNRNDVDFSFRGDVNQSILGSDDEFMGVIRRLELRTIAGTDTQSVSSSAVPATLSLHFPRYLLGGQHAAEVQFFRWNESTRRWILVGAHAELSGTTVTAYVDRLGTYAAWSRSDDLSLDKVVTGLQLTPNPFSPNGDGLYDDLNITYVLPDETKSAIVEIFDKRGTRLRTLKYFVPDSVVNRTLGLKWDGRDDDGREVARGIYIVRVEARDEQDDRVERATEAVAVIR